MSKKSALIETIGKIGQEVSRLQRGSLGVEIIPEVTKTIQKYIDKTELDDENLLAFSHFFTSIQKILSKKE